LSDNKWLLIILTNIYYILSVDLSFILSKDDT
jgi:hypothetical protein